MPAFSVVTIMYYILRQAWQGKQHIMAQHKGKTNLDIYMHGEFIIIWGCPQPFEYTSMENSYDQCIGRYSYIQPNWAFFCWSFSALANVIGGWRRIAAFINSHKDLLFKYPAHIYHRIHLRIASFYQSPVWIRIIIHFFRGGDFWSFYRNLKQHKSKTI